MTRKLLAGPALKAFDAKASKTGFSETTQNLKIALDTVSTRFMSRISYKPRNMSMRDYYGRYVKLSNYLKYFPGYRDNQDSFQESDLVEHFQFAIPSQWQNTMTLQGFEPLAHSLLEFIQFCNRLEALEENSSHPSKVP